MGVKWQSWLPRWDPWNHNHPPMDVSEVREDALWLHWQQNILPNKSWTGFSGTKVKEANSSSDYTGSWLYRWTWDIWPPGLKGAGICCPKWLVMGLFVTAVLVKVHSTQHYWGFSSPINICQDLGQPTWCEMLVNSQAYPASILCPAEASVHLPFLPVWSLLVSRYPATSDCTIWLNLCRQLTYCFRAS